MISIRTITYNMPANLDNSVFGRVKNCINSFNSFKYNVRTTRISSCKYINQNNYYDLINDFCIKNNIKWFSIPVNKSDSDYILELIKKYDRAFVNITGCNKGKMDFNAIDQYIETAKKVSLLSNNGKDNFRFGLSINVENNFPFFPFAKSSNDLSFSIGLELTEEISNIIDSNPGLDLNLLRTKIIETLDKDISIIEDYAIDIENKYNIRFDGFDYSLAPTLNEDGSVFGILEKLGVKELNGSGTFFATAYLTNILKSFGNTHRRIGLSGLMYSLLEDAELSRINNESEVRLEDLMKLSTMCGCGIDMVPINYGTSNDVIKNYILDICAISCRLNKPLGVRFIILPDSMKKTEFNDNCDFIVNTKVVNLSKNVINLNNTELFSLIELKNL